MARSRRWRLASAGTLVLTWTLIAACGRPPARTDDSRRARTPQAAQPADFVVCIDNSRSITPPEQILIREITMLLADLAAPGDRLSVITFGSGARVAASTLIGGDRDRVAFKQEIRRSLTFQEDSSDIRMAVRLLAEQRGVLFRPSGSLRAPILLTDGKLEPVDRKALPAFQEIEEQLRGPLAGINIYAVVLGDTTSRDTILPGLTGRILMEQHIARSPEYFRSASNLDQLLDIGVDILNRTKGISSLGEKGKTRFKVDRSVESMTFIVRKKSSDGRQFCRSSDIRLKRLEPQPAVALSATSQPPAELAASIYWSSDYEYFDVINVQSPAQGIWEVGLAEGGPVDAVAKIVTNIDLQFAAKPAYYLNESAAMTAWLFDRKAGAISRQPFNLRARVARLGKLQDSSDYLALRPNSETGERTLDVPAGLLKALGGAPGDVEIELIAEDPQNPWFIRRSAAIPIQVLRPFIEWQTVSARFTRIPFWKRDLQLGASVDGSAAPDFEAPPRLEVQIDRLIDGLAREWRRAVVDAESGGGRAPYSWHETLPDAGAYRYRYRLAGGTRSKGPFEIYSPWREFDVRFPWWESAAVVLFVLAFVSQATARVRGRLTVQGPGIPLQNVAVAESSFDSRRIPGLKPAVMSFQLKPVRLLFVARWIVLRATGGNVQLNRRPVPAGKKIRIHAAGSQVLSSGAGADAVTIKMNLRV